MYYPEESFDGPPIGYGLDAGSNDVVGGRNQNMGHGMSLHAPLYIPQHMMGMPPNSYIPNVTNSHQHLMAPMNVHGHLSNSSGPSLRTSSEVAPLSYTQPQAPSISHRGTPVYHTSQTQQGQLGLASSAGPSSVSGSSQQRVHAPIASNNLQSQWAWPASSKVGSIPGQHGHLPVSSNNSAPSAPLHGHNISSGPSKSSMNNNAASAAAWNGQPPRTLLSSSNGQVDPRFRTAPPNANVMPSSPTKYAPNQAVSSNPSASAMTSSASARNNPKSVSQFAKGFFPNYTPSSQLSASGPSQLNANLLTQSGSSVASFADASVYVPSSHHPSQQLTSSHHFSRPNPMEEYIAASLKRRSAKQKDSAAAAAGTPVAAAPANAGSTIARPGSAASKDSKAIAAVTSSPSKHGASAANSALANLSIHPPSTTDTTNWQVLDMSNMALVSISPVITLYGHIKALYLQHNRLVTLPMEMCSMPNLQCLDLSFNQLAWLPAEIGQLVSLKELLLSHNQLQNLPVEVGRLFRLHKLTLDENPITNIPLDVMRSGAPEIVQHQRNLLAPSDPPPPRSWLLNAAVDRVYAMPGYFHGLDSLLGPKAVRTVDNGHKQVTIQAKDVAKFRVDGSIRTMTYNILADIYAASLNYCPSWALAWAHRKTTILQEIDTYSPDLLCLQEVVWAQYVQFFQPELEARGYKAIFHPKTRAKYSTDANRIDGCASFYRASMFDQVDYFNIEFQTIAQDHPDRYSTPGDEAGYVRLTSKDNIAIGLVLRRRDRAALAARSGSSASGGGHSNASGGKMLNAGGGAPRRTPSPLPSSMNPPGPVDEDLLVFVNTHIHWDPEFSDVKLMQVQMLMEQLEAWIDEYSNPTGTLEDVLPSQRIPLILGGDFNSKPDSGVYQFLVDGYLPGDHPEFLGYTYGDYTDSGLKHALTVTSANSTLAHEPTFTNYTVDFNGCLDYIWYAQHNLSVERVLNGVDERIVHSYNGALPNPHMPSDHIPLVADFVQNINRRG